MKKAFHQIKGTNVYRVDIRGGVGYAVYVEGHVTTKLGEEGDIRIKIPLSIVLKMMQRFIFSVQKKKTLWWIEDMQYDESTK